MPDLTDRRVLVVGASSGIGAAFARAAAQLGAIVTVAARRADALDELVESMGGGHAVAGDVTRPDDAARVVATAAGAMGGIDLLLYVAGRGLLQRVEHTDPDAWADVFRVNALGANLVTGAALGHTGSDAVCAYVSSRVVDDVNALFGAYSATKAALDQCIRTWRVEHPDRRFVRVVMGNCQPTGFAEHMGSDELITDAIVAWERQAIPGGLMHVDEVGSALAETLAVSLAHPSIDASEIRFDARTA